MASYIGRRNFLATLGSAAAAWPLAARAQQAARIPRVGVLWHAGSAEEEGSNFRALVKGFADLGYVEGRSIVLEHRFPNERSDQFRSMAAELVASRVDVLVSVGANAAPYAKEATTTIPVVFALVPDPLGSKLIKSLARPEENVTGLSNSASDLIGKRLELFKEVVPGLSRVALLVNANSQLASVYTNTTNTAAAALGRTDLSMERARRIGFRFRSHEGRRNPRCNRQSRRLGVHLSSDHFETRGNEWNSVVQLVKADIGRRCAHVIRRRSRCHLPSRGCLCG